MRACAADERRQYLLDLLQSNSLPEAGAFTGDLNELLARTEDEKVLFETVEKALHGKETTRKKPWPRGNDDGGYSRLATGEEIAPLITLALEIRRPEGDYRLQSSITHHAHNICKWLRALLA